MKLGTIGTGAIVDTMFDSIDGIDDIEVRAVYSRDPEKARAFADKHHVLKAYSNLDDLMNDTEIDTVYIASPNALHYPQAKMALEAGKNVVLEKPFTSTMEQAKDLFRLADEKNLMIFEAITNIHTPNYGLLKDNLLMAGRIRQVVFNFSQYSSRYDRYRNGEVTNVFDPEMDGGAAADLNIYNFHLCNGLFGLPEKTTYYPNLGFNDIDTSGLAILEYPDFTAVCIGAKDSMAESQFLIQGEDGTFVISKGSSGVMAQVDFYPVHPGDEDEASVRISIDQGHHMTFEFLDFMTAINENDRQMYEDYKKETLETLGILMDVKKQRDEKSGKQNV